MLLNSVRCISFYKRGIYKKENIMAVPGKRANIELLASSDDDLPVYCQPCDRDGPRLTAFGYCTDCKEHLCETCFKIHKTHTLSKTHVLLEKNNMPRTLSPATRSPATDNRRSVIDLKEPCPNHKKKMIEFFCHDHGVFLCSVCTILDHPSTSCEINYIPDLSVNIIDSREYLDILKTIDDMSEFCKRKFEQWKIKTENLDKSLTDALTDLKKIRIEINKRLDELEKQTENAAYAIIHENSNSLEKFRASYKEISESLVASSETIKHLNKQKQADNLFIKIKMAEKMIKDYQQTIKRLATNDVNEYKFEPNEVVSKLLHKETSLGTWKPKPHRPQRPSNTPCKTRSRKSSSIGEICVKTLKDGSICFVTGMALLAPDLLVIVDQGNSAVKLVDISKKTVLDELTLDDTPWDIASISSSELAVTMSGALLFVSASTKRLVKRHTLNVHGNGLSICCHKDKMVVSFSSPAKVQIMDMDGTVLVTIQDEIVFTGMGYIAACDSCIYISDSKCNTVTKVDWLGKVMCKYNCKGEPRGLTMSNGENVFVCDWTNNVILEIAEDCSEAKLVVKADREPYAVCWCAHTHTMYVSSCSLPNNKRDNFLQMFKLC